MLRVAVTNNLWRAFEVFACFGLHTFAQRSLLQPCPFNYTTVLHVGADLCSVVLPTVPGPLLPLPLPA